MDKSYLSEQNLIFKTPAANSKIYIREQNGHFQRVRRYLNVFLIALFAALPLVQYQGEQAILFDVAKQHLTLFSVTLFPQDLPIFGLIFILAAFGLFYVTKLYGRVWCGYTCPQTVWTLMFNWIERRIEGNHNQSKKLDQQGWNSEKVLKKTAKHLAWGALSLATALVFMSYFVPAAELYSTFFTLEASALVQGWVWFFAFCTYGNGGWLREKMCQHACPYSRFQSVMFDRSTKLVAYDEVRGEGRGARKRGAAKPDGMGDCVDCKLCVQVCPVGIDIRDGLQYECINCGLCIDACDDVMGKFNYAKGLIKYASQAKQKTKWGAHIGYALASVMTIGVMVLWAFDRDEFEVNIVRDRQSLYRVNSQGKIENTFLFKALNKAQTERTYLIQLDDQRHFAIVTKQILKVAPEQHAAIPVSVVAHGLDSHLQVPIEFTVTDQTTGETIDKSSVFYTGEGAW